MNHDLYRQQPLSGFTSSLIGRFQCMSMMRNMQNYESVFQESAGIFFHHMLGHQRHILKSQDFYRGPGQKESLDLRFVDEPSKFLFELSCQNGFLTKAIVQEIREQPQDLKRKDFKPFLGGVVHAIAKPKDKALYDVDLSHIYF